jgi:soluble lytic murein transglycosylase-like protein
MWFLIKCDSQNKCLYSFVFLTAILLSSSAYADVLEVNGHDHHWVVRAEQKTSHETFVSTAQVKDTKTLPVTDVMLSAGPHKWQDRIAQLATKYDVSPALLEAVVWQESRWREGAVSPVGARGLAQLMPGTARDLGVKADDPSQNLEGGARYLRMQLDSFGGDLEKALAAYNAGPGRVRRANGIPNIRETQNYVAAIMARLSEPVRRK